MCIAISKFVLVAVNVVFALFSIIAGGIGIWMAVSKGKVLAGTGGEFENVEGLWSKMQLMTAVILFVAVSFLCLILSITGCIGALKESKPMLIGYSIVVGLLLLLQLVAIGLAAAYGSKVNSELVGILTDTDRTYFLPYNQLRTKNMSKSDSVSHVMNSVHVSLKCCGVTNYTDITDSDTAWSKANPKYNGKAMKVPASCCQLTDDGVNVLANTNDWRNFNRYLVNGSKCPNELSDFHADGCLPALKDALKGHVKTLIIACALYIVVYIACITMACCLIQSNKSRRHQSA